MFMEEGVYDPGMIMLRYNVKIQNRIEEGGTAVCTTD